MMLDPDLHHHRGDPATSVEAAHQACATATGRLRAVMAAHRHHPAGLTDDELQRLLPELGHTAKARRVDLRDAGLLENSGARRPTVKGSPATVWRVTDEGHDWCVEHSVPVWHGPTVDELDQAHAPHLTASRLAGECPLCGRQFLGRAGVGRHLRISHKAVAA